MDGNKQLNVTSSFFFERMVFIRIWLITSFLLFRVWFEVYIEDEILKIEVNSLV